MSMTTLQTIGSIAIWVPLVLPALVGALCLLLWRHRWTNVADAWVAAGIVASGVALLMVTYRGLVPTAAGSLLRIDALSAFMIFTIGVVSLVALWGGRGLRSFRRAADGRFTALELVFVLAMCLAVSTDHLGMLWVAVEATTISTAFLVGYRGGRKAVEAAWKYVILGSVGVVIALLGLVFLFAATEQVGHATLSWHTLSTAHLTLDHTLVKAAVALMALGFATKAGLAPMHFWLPDAHSQAPAPISGLMSGALLSVAFYAILRVQTISTLVLGPTFMRVLLLVAGITTLVVSAAIMLTQRDYKRLLAYSSMEHMGIIAVGAGIGTPVALAAVLLHMLGHGLVKSGMFVLAGRIMARDGSSTITDVRGLLDRHPRLGVGFAVGMIGLLGIPPFPLFFTEVAIVLSGWSAGLGAVMAVVLVLLLVAFAGLTRQALRIITGPSVAQKQVPSSVTAPTPSRWPSVPLYAAVVASVALSVTAWPVTSLLKQAAAVLGTS